MSALAAATGTVKLPGVPGAAIHGRYAVAARCFFILARADRAAWIDRPAWADRAARADNLARASGMAPASTDGSATDSMPCGMTGGSGPGPDMPGHAGLAAGTEIAPDATLIASTRLAVRTGPRFAVRTGQRPALPHSMRRPDATR